MEYESYDQKKAVLTKYYYSGKLYDPEYFILKAAQESYEANSKVLKRELEKEKKRLEQERKKLDIEKIKKEIEVCEKKFQNKPVQRRLIKKIKRLIYFERPKEYEAIKSLSFEFTDVIREAKQDDIDKNIIALLREKQQQLAKIIIEHDEVEREISRIDSLIYFGIDDSLYSKIADLIIRAEKAYIDKKAILQLRKKINKYPGF